MAARTVISTDRAPRPIGGYSQGVVAGGLLFVAGQGSYRPDGSFAPGTVAEQVAVTLGNIEAIAAEAGTTLANAVRVGVFLSDIEHWAEMDAEYRRHVPEPRPARTATQCDLGGIDVEIDAVILVP